MPLTKGSVQPIHTNDTVHLPTVAVDRNLGVLGNSVFDGAAIFNSGVSVTGPINVTGTISASGVATVGALTTTGVVNINTSGLGQINLGDGNIQKQAGTGFIFNSSGTFSQGVTVNANGIALNYASPAITSNNASTASIFTSNVTGITIGSSTIRTTKFPADGTTATAAAGSGYMGMPQVSTATTREFVASDAGKHIYVTATGQTLTIPANTGVAFPIGTTIVVVNASGVSTSIAITTDTLRLANSASTGTRTLASNGMCTLLKTTATTWIASGNGLT
jgi:hypothetical protein